MTFRLDSLGLQSTLFMELDIHLPHLPFQPSKLVAALRANPQSVTGPGCAGVQPSQSLCSHFLFKFLLLSYLQWTFPSTDYLPFSNPTNISFSFFFWQMGPKMHRSMQKEWATVHSIKKLRSCTATEQIIETRAWVESKGHCLWPLHSSLHDNSHAKIWQQNLCFSHPHTHL